MKNSRFRYTYRGNASKLHRKIGDVLKSPQSIFSNYKIYQEYPVNKVNPSYSNASHKFDWVILDLSIVIEAHGEQHYKPVAFGGVSQEEAEFKLAEQKHRDNMKAQAAVDAGFTYIEIPYLDINKIDENYIFSLYKKCFNYETIQKEVKVETNYQLEQKERARQYRHQQYLKKKEWLRRLKEQANEKD